MKNSSSKNIEMNLDHYLDGLKKVERINPPENLFMSIQNQIDQGEQSTGLSIKSWSIGIAASILLIMSISFVIKQHDKNQNNDELKYAQELDLLPQNQLYK